LHTKRLLKHVIEEKTEGTRIRGRRHKNVLNEEKILAFEIARTGSHCLENVLSKRLQTCPRTDNAVNGRRNPRDTKHNHELQCYSLRHWN
jgi:hypothetical protein